MKKVLAFLLTLAVVLAIFPVALADGAVPVTLKASEPDSNGLFTLTLSIKDVDFNTVSFVFSYDIAQVEPVDALGNKTSKFRDFGECLQDDLNTIGLKLDAQKGLFECGAYVIGGMVADNEGVELFAFKFKKIGTGNPGFKLATETSGGPYNDAIPNGGAVTESVCEGCPVPMLRVGIEDKFGRSGKVPPLMEMYGLTVENLVAKAKAAIALKK